MKNITKYALALLIAMCSLLIELNAQVAINEDNSEPDASAMLDVSSTDKGLLIPRMDSTSRNSITNPAEGLMVFDSTTNSFWYYTTNWIEIGTATLLADTDGDTHIAVEKGEDDDLIRFELEGTEFMRLDSGRVEILNTGGSVFIGSGAGANDDFSTNENVFIGDSTGYTNTTGRRNVIIGAGSGSLITTGSENAIMGYFAGSRNSTGDENVFLGNGAGERNTTGNYNTYIGQEAGRLNTSGSDNIFIGHEAGFNTSVSNTLFIHNNPSSFPLIYGNFSKDSLQINGKLNINGAFNFPTTDGLANQVLITDGNGTLNWGDGTDNLGDHSATQNIALNGNFLSNDGENEGIQIDDEGKVGIGLNPTAHLSVKTGGNGIETLDANNTTAPNFYTATGDTWQSYTVLNDGILSRIELEFGDASGTRTVSIYEGEGTAGNLLGTAITDVSGSGTYLVSFDLSTNQIGQLAGEVYTIAIDSRDRLFLSSSDPYDGGREKRADDRDLYFKVYAEGLGSFNVSSEGVNINNYTLPRADGDANQLLATDGNGNLDWVDEPTFTDTDNQTIDKLNLNGTTLELSLEDDGQSDQTVDLASLDTDEQTIDKLNLNGTTLEISLEGDGQSDQTVDLASLDTDKQTIDKLNLNGTTLEISLEGDGQSDQTVDLASLDTDEQTIDKLNLNGTTLEISLEGDGQSDKTVDLASIDTNTDNQSLSLNGKVLNIDDGTGVDLTALLVPVGTIQMWPTSSPPSGWLICDGSTFSASTYPELNSILGGNTLPNFNGRFPLGVGNSGTTGSTSHSIKSTGGEETHVLTINEMPSHSHGINYTGRNKSGSGGEVSDLESSNSTTPTTSTGGGQAHNNMPPFYTINFIIKAE